MRILFSNLGYARGLDGSLHRHVGGMRHYLRCPPEIQQRTLAELKTLLHRHQVDLACLAEIDTGTPSNRFYDQMHFLRDPDFPHGTAIDKYRDTGSDGPRGRSNGFLSREPLPHRTRYLSSGTKRLVCQIAAEEYEIWFGHFSLRSWIRRRQFAEIASWIAEAPGEILLLGDFNNYHGPGELRPLTEGRLRLMNPPGPTFRLGTLRASVDLCLATPGLAERCRVSIVPQHYSDHDALLVELA